jgi:hypothetical protein
MKRSVKRSTPKPLRKYYDPLAELRAGRDPLVSVIPRFVKAKQPIDKKASPPACSHIKRVTRR